MGKALMVLSTQTALANGRFLNVYGTDGFTTTEAQAQAKATEGMTFSNIRANVIAGNSGTATYRFRDAGANGNQTFQISGAAAGEDATNTDVLVTDDLFALSYADTGSDSDLGWIAMNVEFGSGHGNLHGASNFPAGPVYDDASQTRYIPFAGPLNADGSNTEAHVQWKVRGYSSLETFQVRVTANARTTDTVITSRINGGNGGLSITIGAGVTGLLTATGTPDSLADGDLAALSIAYGTGVEDLTISFVLGTFKSSASKSESFFGGGSTVAGAGGWVRAASATASYAPIGGRVTSAPMTDAQARIKPGFACVVSNLRCNVSANTYTGAATMKLMVNGVAAISWTIDAGATGWQENTSDTTTIDADDELSIEFDEGTSGNLTVRSGGVTFAPIAAATSKPLLLLGVGG